jgi:hypothetical protein
MASSTPAAPVLDAPAVLKAAQSVLAPYVGEKTARAWTSETLRKLGIGIGEDHMSLEELASLLDGLGTSLAVIVGQQKTAGLIEEIRARFVPRSA